MALPIDRILGDTPAIISSGFGLRKAPRKGASTDHQAADISAPIGTPVHALASGTISKIGYDEINGHYLHIDHGNGYVTKHGHLNQRPNLTVGSQVKEGDKVANVGNTGNSTGPHLHLALEKDGKRIDVTKIPDLEQHIRPTGNQITTKDLLLTGNNKTETAPAITTTTPATTTTTTTMANPEKQQSYVTSSGKSIKDFTAQDIMRIGAAAGSTTTDIKRGIKGLEDLQKRGYDISIDAESGTFKVTGPNGGVINPSKKGAGNVKGFDIGDIVGAGRNVNYLAGILSKVPKSSEAPTPEKADSFPAYSEKAIEEFRQKWLEKSQNDYKMPELSAEVLDEPKFEEIPYDKSLGQNLFNIDESLHNGYNLKGKVNGDKEILNYFKTRSQTPSVHQLNPANISLNEIGKGPKMEFSQEMYDKMLNEYSKNPKLSKEEIATKIWKETSNKRAGLIAGTTLGLMGASALAPYANIPALMSRINMFKNVLPKAENIRKYTAASRAAAKKAAEIAQRQSTKVKAGIERAGEINRQAQRMAEGYEKGGVLGAKDLMKRATNDMGIPRYQDGNKFPFLSSDDVYTGEGTKVSLNTLPLAQIKSISDMKPGKVDLSFPDVQESPLFNKDARLKYQKPKEVREGSISDFQKFKNFIGNNGADIARYTLPFIGERYARKELKTTPVKTTPVELMKGTVSDLPKTYQPMLNRVENRGSDLLTNMAMDKYRDAYNKDKNFQWNLQNAMSRRQQMDNILANTNRERMINAEMAQRNNIFNSQLAAQMGVQRYQSKLSPILAVNQMANEDISQRRYLDAYTKSKEMELEAKRGERSYADLLGATQDEKGIWTTKSGKKYDANGNPIINAKGGKLKIKK